MLDGVLRRGRCPSDCSTWGRSGREEAAATCSAWLGLDAHIAHAHARPRPPTTPRSTCFAILREAPIRAVTLTLLLEILAEHCGADLLRLKGIVNVAESPDRPAVIHGVQHVFHPPAWLERWPSADRRSRLVFIVRGIPQAWVEALLDALEAEVGEVSERELTTAALYATEAWH